MSTFRQNYTPEPAGVPRGPSKRTAVALLVACGILWAVGTVDDGADQHRVAQIRLEAYSAGYAAARETACRPACTAACRLRSALCPFSTSSAPPLAIATTDHPPEETLIHLTHGEHEALLSARAERDRLHALVNSPETLSFLRGVHLEAVHQVERWGNAHDRAKRPADWFWLVGYLAGKALHAAIAGDTDKARHHTISTAAALYNWHCAISGHDVRMCPGRSDIAQIVDAAFPGEAH